LAISNHASFIEEGDWSIPLILPFICAVVSVIDVAFPVITFGRIGFVLFPEHPEVIKVITNPAATNKRLNMLTCCDFLYIKTMSLIVAEKSRKSTIHTRRYRSRGTFRRNREHEIYDTPTKLREQSPLFSTINNNKRTLK
jgi:hypothetical protein